MSKWEISWWKHGSTPGVQYKVSVHVISNISPVSLRKSHAVFCDFSVEHASILCFLPVENENHCDFVKLREMLVRVNMEDLREQTHARHYELYRRCKLEEMGFKDTDPDSKSFRWDQGENLWKTPLWPSLMTISFRHAALNSLHIQIDKYLPDARQHWVHCPSLLNIWITLFPSWSPASRKHMKPRGRSSSLICSAKRRKWDRCLSTKWRRPKLSWRRRKRKWERKLAYLWKVPRSLVCLTVFSTPSSMSGLSSSSGCTRRKRRPWRRKGVTWKKRWTLSTEERWQLRRWWGRLSKAVHSHSRRTRTRRSKSAFLFGTCTRWLDRTSSADVINEIILSSQGHDGSETDTETDLGWRCVLRHRRGHCLHDAARCTFPCRLTYRAEALLIMLTSHRMAHCLCSADNSVMVNIKANLDRSQERFCLIGFIFIATRIEMRLLNRIEDEECLKFSFKSKKEEIDSLDWIRSLMKVLIKDNI